MNTINHIEQVEKILSEGKQPTVDQLGEALAQSIDDLNVKTEIINDMANWLGRLSAAHIKKDALTVKNILDEFIQKKVKVITVSNINLH